MIKKKSDSILQDFLDKPKQKINPYTNMEYNEINNFSQSYYYSGVNELTIKQEKKVLDESSPEIVEDPPSIAENLIIKSSPVPQTATHYAKRNVEILDSPAVVNEFIGGNIYKARPNRPIRN